MLWSYFGLHNSVGLHTTMSYVGLYEHDDLFVNLFFPMGLLLCIQLFLKRRSRWSCQTRLRQRFVALVLPSEILLSSYNVERKISFTISKNSCNVQLHPWLIRPWISNTLVHIFWLIHEFYDCTIGIFYHSRISQTNHVELMLWSWQLHKVVPWGHLLKCFVTFDLTSVSI